jgi:hypothetical protein
MMKYDILILLLILFVNLDGNIILIVINLEDFFIVLETYLVNINRLK